VADVMAALAAGADPALLTAYLDAHAASLSRTTLSYPTEHLTPERRIHYRSLR